MRDLSGRTVGRRDIKETAEESRVGITSEGTAVVFSTFSPGLLCFYCQGYVSVDLTAFYKPSVKDISLSHWKVLLSACWEN